MPGRYRRRSTRTRGRRSYGRRRVSVRRRGTPTRRLRHRAGIRM